MGLETIPQGGEKINKELMSSITEDVDKFIKEKGVDADRIAEIAETLKEQGISAGDELNERAFMAYRQELIDQEFKKQSLN